MIENKLVPKHEVLSLEGAEQVLKKYNVTYMELPKILQKDSSIVHLKAATGDIIRITRKNPITGVSFYYRVVIEG